MLTAVSAQTLGRMRSLRKTNDRIVQRHFFLTPVRDSIRLRFPAILASFQPEGFQQLCFSQHIEGFKLKWQSFPFRERLSVAYLKVQVRRIGVAGVSQ